MLFRHRSRARSHKKVWWKRHLKVLILLIFSLFFICGGLAAIWFSTLQIPDLSAFEARQVAESTKIYDRTGEVLLYDIHSDERRTVVPFDQISKYIKMRQYLSRMTGFTSITALNQQLFSELFLQT
jgi:membrane peptidoglycan carboxypeptidase